MPFVRNLPSGCCYFVEAKFTKQKHKIKNAVGGFLIPGKYFMTMQILN